MSEKTTYPNPNRIPKRYPEKNLHGRTRWMVATYKDFRRYLNFCVKVFGWDIIEAPEATCGIPAGDPHPTLIITTGPAQYDYEAVAPGFMNVFAHYAPGNLEPIGPHTEIDMEVPLETTVQKMLDRGATLVLDKNISTLAKPLDDSKQSWEVHAVIRDIAGNYLYLWKCPSSRTWDELECDYDKD